MIKKDNMAFAQLQKIGQSLMLPVSVLPIAGILLGLGAAQRTDGSTILPEAAAAVLNLSGGSIFGAMPLLFAIGVIIGFTGSEGSAALAGIVGYMMFNASLGAAAGLMGLPTVSVLGVDTLDTGVLGGIVMGGVAAALYNRFHAIKLPEFLSFFSGKRFVPIVTGLAGVFLGLIFSFVWPPLGKGIDAASNWAAYQSPALAFFIFGFIKRLLLPFGLHHIWNAPFFTQIGSFVNKAGITVTGEIPRFLNGDPTAGRLAGDYLTYMFGLPAAALAIQRAAKPENRAAVAGIMGSAALTSFLTGITEPIEFTFLFVAPVLYVIHALFAGCSYIVTALLDIRIGTTFSQGLIDYIILFPLSHNSLLIWPLGAAWFAGYFTLFSWFIRAFNINTMGRGATLLEPLKKQPAVGKAKKSGSTASQEDEAFAAQLVKAYGGPANLENISACITRLRITVKDLDKVDQAALKSLGAANVLIIGNGTQAVFGPKSDNYAQAMQTYLSKSQIGRDD